MYPENGRNPYYAEVMPASSAWPYVKDLEVLSALHEGGLSDALRLAEHHALVPRHGGGVQLDPMLTPA